MKLIKLTTAIIVFSFLLINCGGGGSSTTSFTEVGKDFIEDEEDIFIIDKIEYFKIKTVEGEEGYPSKSLVAPKGKKYLNVEYTKNLTIGDISVTVNGEEVEDLEYTIMNTDLFRREEDGDKEMKNQYFLLDDGATPEIFVNTIGGTKNPVTIVPTDNTSNKVSDKMHELVETLNAGGNHFINTINKYCDDKGYDIITEKGSISPGNPAVFEVEYDYASEDGNSYRCKGKSVLGTAEFTLNWDGDKIKDGTIKFY